MDNSKINNCLLNKIPTFVYLSITSTTIFKSAFRAGNKRQGTMKVNKSNLKNTTKLAKVTNYIKQIDYFYKAKCLMNAAYLTVSVNKSDGYKISKVINKFFIKPNCLANF